MLPFLWPRVFVAARPVVLAMLGIGALASAACSPQATPGDEGIVASTLAVGDATHGRHAESASPYPLSLAPPVWTERQKLLASDGAAQDVFGTAVSLHGDTALVGATGADHFGVSTGAVFVFLRNATSWTEQAKLLASDATTAGSLGASVALSDNTAVAGDIFKGEVVSPSGSAYVFVRTATGWSQEAKLMASDASFWDDFGESVAIDGNTLLIGASGHTDAATNGGAAYVFERSATTWTMTQKLKSSDMQTGDAFGTSVALSGDTAVVGASGDDDAGFGAGSAYVFVRAASSWVERAKLIGSDTKLYDAFGQDTSLSADTAIIGASADNDEGIASGAAYVFVRDAEGWPEQVKLLPSDGAVNDYFGGHVAVSGDLALVGAFGDDDGDRGTGSAYVFARDAAAWREQRKLTASDAALDDRFGVSVALHGELAFAGANYDDDLGHRAGSAYVFALRLPDGEPCSSDVMCVSKRCVDGFCCDGLCDGPCESCRVASQEGTCTLTPQGVAPTSDCGGYLCSGTKGGCATECRGDTECTAEYYCRGALACLPRAADGQACIRDESCVSGHCIDGVCCGQACDGGCGSCVVEGSEGRCMPLALGHPGTPGCAPYACTGTDLSCATTCAHHDDCGVGFHCAEGACEEDALQGAACTSASSCATGYCTDEVCCVAETCGAYRCGAAGTCQNACSSSAQCAQGHACDSAGRCEPRSDAAAPVADSGACSLVSAPAPSGALSWLSGLGLLGCLGAARRRRPRRAGRATGIRLPCSMRRLTWAIAGLLGSSSSACSPEAALGGEEVTSGTQAASDADLQLGEVVGAAYPLLMAPPVWVERQQLLASDGAAGDDFGGSVAIRAEMAIVGDPDNSAVAKAMGAAYVFVRSAATWVEQQKLMASDAAGGDVFGAAVALGDALAIVGASMDDDAGPNSGSAYVFARNATTWVEQAKLAASDAAAWDAFGRRVALSGDSAIIGAANNGDGAAYVFVRSASSWTEQQKLVASAPAWRDAFGASVALSGDVAVVGATVGDMNATHSGSAYIFVRSATVWTEVQKIVASDASTRDKFGTSVALSQGALIVGATDNDQADNSSGAAYVFTRSAAIWTEDSRLIASDAALLDRFGRSVSLSGERALVGASDNNDAGSYSGSAYLFARSAATWSEERKLTASNAAEGDRFGIGVALDGDNALIGATGKRNDGVAVGAAYVFGLRLLDGEPCSGDAMCASALCADGVCCDRACEGPCETCNAASLEGTCTPKPRGNAPTVDCRGHLCDGTSGICPARCGGDADCVSEQYCQEATLCLPRAVDGQACIRAAGCLSGHCVDGICCGQACDEGCGSCVVAGFEGVCTAALAGHPGAPSCTPYVCTGAAVSCPSDCSNHDVCGPGHYCGDARCQPEAAQGAACSSDRTCGTRFCTDGICCVADSCGAYRCGPAGGCEDACSSSAQCADGHACNSAGSCEPLPADSAASSESGSCAITRRVAPTSGALSWLGLFACLAARRRRRRSP